MRGPNKLAIAIVLILGCPAVALAQSTPVQNDPYYGGQQTPARQASQIGSGGLVDPTGPATLPLFDWAIGLGAGRTDNLARTSTNRVSQTMLQPTFNFAYNKQGSTFQGQVLGMIRYTDFVEGYYGNEFRGQLTGRLNWVLVPRRLNFEVQDYSSVEPVNTRFGDDPENLQQVNVLVAGPTVAFRLGANPTWHGLLDLRYINTTASKTKTFESQRGFMAARFIHDLSTTNHLSLNLEGAHVDFQNVNSLANAARYDQYNAYVRYESRLERVELGLALGGSRVLFPGSWEDHSGTYFRASVTWRMSARNSLQLVGSDQLTDATANLTQSPTLGSTQLTNPTLVVGQTVISPAVFRNRVIRLGYGFVGTRFDFTLSPYYARLRQLNGDILSRNDYGAVFGMSYNLTPLTSIGLRLMDRNTKYLSDDSLDRDHTASLNFSQRLTPDWSWRLRFSHAQHTSDRPGYGYTTNEVFAYLYYQR